MRREKMKQSESIKEIAPALVKAQAKVKAAIKDSQNPFFKNKYADLASVIEAVRTPFNDAGISFLQPVSSVEEGVCVETMLIHTSGEWLSESLVMPVAKHDAQAVGSAITYGRRYGLQSLCGVPSEDDDGERATKTQTLPKAAITPTTGAWDALDEPMKHRLTDLALMVKEYIEASDVEAALHAIDDATLTSEETIGLWSRFNSAERSAMKKKREELKKVPA